MRSVKGRTFVKRASTRKTLSMSRLLKGQNGTRFEPPRPFKLVLKAAPVNGAPEMKIVAVAGWADAIVVICDNCHPLISHLENVESLRVSVGAQMELITRRWR